MSDDRWEGRGGPVNKRPTAFQATKYKAPRWYSKQAPGTTPRMEALFLLIQRGMTDKYAFTYNRKRLTDLTDEQIWECYLAWCEGKVHPLLLNKEET